MERTRGSILDRIRGDFRGDREAIGNGENSGQQNELNRMHQMCNGIK
jgi:hypothetical protein